MHFLTALWGLVPDNEDGWTYLPLKLGLKIGASRLLWVAGTYTVLVLVGAGLRRDPRRARAGAALATRARPLVFCAMQPRRSLRLVAGALVLALPLLGSCGFNKATDKVYTPGEGTNDRDGDVDVLSAVVVAAQPDSGTFVASLSNNSPDEDVELAGVAGAGDWRTSTVDPSDLSIEIPARGFVNLVNEDPDHRDR